MKLGSRLALHGAYWTLDPLDTQWRQWFTTMFRLTDG